jgi:hypothetical protein
MEAEVIAAFKHPELTVIGRLIKEINYIEIHLN